MPRPTVAEAQGREAIYDAPQPSANLTQAARPPREERIERKTYHLDRELVRLVADAAGPGLTQSQVVNTALRRYFAMDEGEATA